MPIPSVSGKRVNVLAIWILPSRAICTLPCALRSLGCNGRSLRHLLLNAVRMVTRDAIRTVFPSLTTRPWSGQPPEGGLMIPGQIIVDRIRTLLATDTTTFALAATPGKIHLAINSFSPSAALLVGSFTEATFVGYAALSLATGPQQTFNDSLTGGRVMQLVEPLGGWHWQTTATTSLPQTVYGFYCTDNGNAALWGSQLLPAPVPLNAIGDAVDIGNVRISFPPGIYV